MNFLQLVDQVAEECGVSGGGPSTVVSQSGELKRLVDWTAQAYTEIQNRFPNWKWMRSTFTVNTVAHTDSYAFGAVTDDLTSQPIARFKWWWVDDGDTPAKCYPQASGVSGQKYLIWLPWEYFKQLYKFGPQQTHYGPPVHVSVDPQRNLVLGPNPDGIYVIQGDFQRGAQSLAADADTPDMPSDYHYAIVYRAMLKYGVYEAAGEVIARAREEGARIMRQLEQNQLPQIRLGAPMA